MRLGDLKVSAEFGDARRGPRGLRAQNSNPSGSEKTRSTRCGRRRQTPGIPDHRTKQELFLDRALGSWHSQLQWEIGAGGEAAAAPLPCPSTHPSMRPRRPGALARAPEDGAAMSSLDLFLPLMKVDLDRRLVTGVATAETPDRSGEICDYASSKPYFEKWSTEALEASGGKSLGAVRAMHGRVAAGKLTGIEFDDEAKRVVVAAKIVDDDEWRKVTEGVYTGFSQGGRYVKRWPDPDSSLVRYTAEPHEISLVDLPCLPDATFEVVKDGVVEKRAFAPRPDPADSRSAAAGDRGAQRCRANVGSVLQGRRRARRGGDQARAGGRRKPAPAQDARRRFAGARRSRQARRRARSPAGARQSRAARGRQGRRRRRGDPRRRRSGPPPRRAASGSARARADQTQPRQSAALLKRAANLTPANRRRRGVRRRGGRKRHAGHRLAQGGDRFSRPTPRPPRETCLSTNPAATADPVKPPGNRS